MGFIAIWYDTVFEYRENDHCLGKMYAPHLRTTAALTRTPEVHERTAGL